MREARGRNEETEGGKGQLEVLRQVLAGRGEEGVRGGGRTKGMQDVVEAVVGVAVGAAAGRFAKGEKQHLRLGHDFVADVAAEKTEDDRYVQLYLRHTGI